MLLSRQRQCTDVLPVRHSAAAEACRRSVGARLVPARAVARPCPRPAARVFGLRVSGYLCPTLHAFPHSASAPTLPSVTASHHLLSIQSQENL